MAFGTPPVVELADRRILVDRRDPCDLHVREIGVPQIMTIPVKPGTFWKTSHLILVWSMACGWTAGILFLAIDPAYANPLTRGIALGTTAMMPHIWLGRSIWHKEGRTGIGIPIAVMIIRFSGSLILLSLFLWQFPAENRIIAWTVSTLIIVFTAIESFLFCKGVERL
jgi:hypothetical protein